jgi:CubicO group peptidase (beta-lactamase class C family)
MEKRIKIFTNHLKELQKEYKIPGLSFVITHKNKIISKEGLGYADIDKKIKAEANTQYRIASLTKPISATIILKLVELGKLKLDDPISELYPNYRERFPKIKKWFVEKNITGVIDNYDFERDDITIKHHLSHTSEGIPGENYNYSGFLFGELTKVINNVSEVDFETLFKREIIEKLNMESTIICKENEEYDKKPERLAIPYYTDEKGNQIKGEYPLFDLNTAAGIISTVEDIAKFDIALNKNQIISKQSKELAYTPMITSTGHILPYGLGWFIQNNDTPNKKILWHYGFCDNCISTLYVKILGTEFTLILLANSDCLCNFSGLAEKGDVSRSPFAEVFLEVFLQK